MHGLPSQEVPGGGWEVRKIHYAGPIKKHRMKILPGWAACCSGPKAEEIRNSGWHSNIRSEVTCAACLRQIKAHDAYAASMASREGGVE